MVLTVISASPGPTAVTVPESFTVATLILLLTQLTAVLAALAGVTAALRDTGVSPTRITSRWGVRRTPVTAISVTVTVQVAVLPLPSVAEAVIRAVPGATAVTTPPLTVATLSLSELHASAGVVTVTGARLAVSFAVAPCSRERVVRSSVTPVASTFTDTVQAAVLPLSAATLTTDLPPPTAVTVTVPRRVLPSVV